MSANPPITIHGDFENVPVSRLSVYRNNPRSHSEAQVLQLMNLISHVGYINAIVVDENYMVLAGHCRLIAARRLGMTSVRVQVVRGLTDAQKRVYVIADNKVAENATWETDMLNSELALLQTDGFDFGAFGFDDLSLSTLGDENVTTLTSAPVESTNDVSETTQNPNEPSQNFYPFSVNLNAEDRAFLMTIVGQLRQDNLVANNADALIYLARYYDENI